jgi:hypothetical protein
MVLNSITKISKPKKLLCLSYNICWECMENSSVGSAGKLGEKCFLDRKGNSICYKRIIKLIDTIETKYKKKIDFIGLQEVSNWYNIIKDSKVAKKMNQLNSKSGNEYHLTLYHPKYNLLYAYEGEFYPGRSFHILVFDSIILVNLHYCNNGKEKYNEYGKCQDISKIDFLNPDLDLGLRKLRKIGILNRNIQLLNEVKLSDIEIKNKFINHRVIITGDFNSHYLNRKSNIIIKYKPFGLLPQIIKGKGIPSCCYKDNIIDYKHMSCDYVFDSQYNSGYLTEIPKNYDKTKIYSDHLPIIYYTKSTIKSKIIITKKVKSNNKTLKTILKTKLKKTPITHTNQLI